MEIDRESKDKPTENPSVILARMRQNRQRGEGMDRPQFLSDVYLLGQTEARNLPKTAGLLKTLGRDKKIRSAVLDKLKTADEAGQSTQVTEGLDIARLLGMNEMPKVADIEKKYSITTIRTKEVTEVTASVSKGRHRFWGSNFIRRLLPGSEEAKQEEEDVKKILSDLREAWTPKEGESHNDRYAKNERADKLLEELDKMSNGNLLEVIRQKEEEWRNVYWATPNPDWYLGSLEQVELFKQLFAKSSPKLAQAFAEKAEAYNAWKEVRDLDDKNKREEAENRRYDSSWTFEGLLNEANLYWRVEEAHKLRDKETRKYSLQRQFEKAVMDKLPVSKVLKTRTDLINCQAEIAEFGLKKAKNWQKFYEDLAEKAGVEIVSEEGSVFLRAKAAAGQAEESTQVQPADQVSDLTPEELKKREKLLELLAEREAAAKAAQVAGKPEEPVTAVTPAGNDREAEIKEGLKRISGALIDIWQNPGSKPVELAILMDQNKGEKIIGDNFIGFVLPSNEDENTVCEDRAGFVELADGTKIFLGADGVGGSYMGGLAAEKAIAVAVKVLKDSGIELLNQAFDQPELYVKALGSYMMEYQQDILEHYSQNIQNNPDWSQLYKNAFADRAKSGSQTTFFMVAISPAGQVRYLSVGDGILEKIAANGEVGDFLSTERGVYLEDRFGTVEGFVGDFEIGTIQLKEGETLLFGTDGMKHNLKGLQQAFSSGSWPAKIPQVGDDLTVFAYRQGENPGLF